MKRRRLSLALRTLNHMAGDPDRVSTSAAIAVHAGPNPVVVRRALERLREAGLLTSERGHAGRWLLACKPGRIALADVYITLDERLVSNGESTETPACPVEHALQERIAGVLEDIKESLVQGLAEAWLSDVHGRW